MTIAVIAVIGVFFAGMGCYALAAPDAIIRPFGITLGSSAAPCAPRTASPPRAGACSSTVRSAGTTRRASPIGSPSPHNSAISVR